MRETGCLRVLIVDDEAPARHRLRDLLADIASDLTTEVVGEAANGIEALEILAHCAADVALVDIRMPSMDGIALAQHLAARTEAPVVIFVTAYDQYAVRAFELNAIDYLLKPVRAQRLLAALRKHPNPQAMQTVLRELSPQGRTHLHSSERGRILLIAVDTILFLRAEHKYVTAQTKERDYLLEESLSHLEEELGERFIRIHRNCLVARTAVIGVERTASEDGETHWVVLLRDHSEKLAVSRRQWPQIKALVRAEE